MIISKVTKNHGFTYSLEDALDPPPAVLGLNINTNQNFDFEA